MDEPGSQGTQLGAIAEEGKPCLRCGYDLRGMTEKQRCPECGLSVGVTLSPRESLSDCPPGWVRRLAVGCGVVLLSWLMIPAAGMLSGYLVGSWYQPWKVAILPLLVAFLFHGYGVWMIGLREPGKQQSRRQAISGWLMSVASLGPLLAVGQLFGSFLRDPVLAALCLLAIGFLCPAFMFVRLRRLAIRIGRPRLAEHSAIVGIGMTSSVLLYLIGLLVLNSGRSIMLIVVVPVAAVIMTYFWGLVLLFRCTVAFWRSARAAAEIWRAASA